MGVRIQREGVAEMVAYEFYERDEKREPHLLGHSPRAEKETRKDHGRIREEMGKTDSRVTAQQPSTSSKSRCNPLSVWGRGEKGEAGPVTALPFFVLQPVGRISKKKAAGRKSLPAACRSLRQPTLRRSHVLSP